ncbi:uncharacterized protein [Venturia canescens]|uniref:uncharacterized protein isoform X2 n=1 Tax=Venturia canescens TaxID=32260 RepID=UPI001C9C26AB|nr:uncharacterized protein LOC122407577 isoform X2 [Venturia canescens]
MNEAQELLDDPTKHFHYYSNVCGMCQVYGEGIKLQRCSGCRMIAYCSKLHQSDHWPRHKEICPVLKTLMKGTDTIYGINKSWEDKAWMKHRELLIALIIEKLGRTLSLGEFEMLAFPRSCQTCHETDPSKLTDCQECPDTSFCIKHPKDKEHLAKCKVSRLHFETNNAMVKKLCFAPYIKKYIPQNMDQAVGLHMSEFLSLEYPTSAEACVALYSERLTRAETFLYALKKLSRSELRCMTIHVVEADDEVLYHDFFIKYFMERDESIQELTIFYFCSDLLNKINEEQSKDNQKSINSVLKKKNEIFWTGKNPFSSMRPSKALDEEFYYNCSYLTIYEKLG